MKPDFALELSVDGLTLLQRAGAAGWRRVGAVALDAPDLSGALSALRAKAMGLARSGLATMLVIPDDQIRYLDLAADPSAAWDPAAAAAAALDGATPYALADLSFDWSVRGDRLLVAAVANETLREAEDFARDHGFNPVCFTARPGDDRFAGEPDFGPTEAATKTAAETEERPAPTAAGSDTAPQDAAALPASALRAAPAAPSPAAPRLSGASRRPPDPPAAQDAHALGLAAQASLVARDEARPVILPPIPRETSTTAPAVRSSKPNGATDPDGMDEAARLTIFGARTAPSAARGRPRFLGLILTAALLLALIGVAALAAVFPDSSLGRLLRSSEPQIAVTPDLPDIAPAPRAAAVPEPAPGVAQPTDAPAPAAPPVPPERDTAQIDRAPGGIRPATPTAAAAPAGDSLDALYQTSIDAALNFGDAIALPQGRDLAPDLVPSRPMPPPPAGQVFAMDARGVVAAKPDGVMTPEGVRVHAGPPPLRPPNVPTRAVSVPDVAPTEETPTPGETVSRTRPRERPATLIEDNERGALGGRSRVELAVLRPRARPDRPTGPDTAAIDKAAIDTALTLATEQAVPESLKPRLRPASIARAAAATPAPTRTARTAAPAPARAAPAPSAPQLPTTASIAQRATERNAINLRQVNLIGVYGAPSDRRALVRLSNGSYRKVKVGDRIDGGQVAAIGESELRYVKSGRSVVLRLPRG